MSSDEDEARLLAALSLAFRSVPDDGFPGESFEAKLARLGEAMVGQRWQITVARDLKLSIGAWLARPWHCWKLRTLVRLLLVENLDPRREVEAINLLTRCAAMVEFGVDVNASWYRRLRIAVAEGRTTSPELRSLLRRATVWWGTAPRKLGANGSALGMAKRLWKMGRPGSGELLIAEHHWLTRFLLLVLLALSGFALAVVTVGLAHHLITRGSAAGLAPIVMALYTYGLLFWAAWWFGPHSWSAVLRLRALLELDGPGVSAASA